MDTQNDGLEKVDSFKIWPYLVSMLDFSGVCLVKGFFRVAWYFSFWQHLYISTRGTWRMGFLVRTRGEIKLDANLL